MIPIFKITGKELLEIIKIALSEEIKTMTGNGVPFNDIDISDIELYMDEEKEFEVRLK